jgi:tetratricopeptide (TPR) repeat protein
MARWILALTVSCAAAFGADQLKKERPKPPTSAQEEIPPEEDVTLTPKEYSFNPLQAEKEVKIGNYYFNKGSFRAAAMRFTEATKWNEGMADAWLRLGEAQDKLKDRKAAKEAYVKYLELAPDAKNAAEIRKKIAQAK